MVCNKFVVLQVYAVEASSMAEFTRQLVKQNGCEEVVSVLQGRAEELELPEQVDVLVSEWMGNCLLVRRTPPLLSWHNFFIFISNMDQIFPIFVFPLFSI